MSIAPDANSLVPVNDPRGRLDVAASRIAGRLIFHTLHENGLGDLAEGIGELATPFLEGIFSEMFGKTPISLPQKLVEGITHRISNGMDSRVSQHRQKKSE